MLNHFIILLSKQLWRLISALFWLGLWLFGLGVLFWYILRWWPGDRLLFVRLGNYFMPWLLIGLIPGLLMAGLAWRKGLMMTLALPTLMIGFTFAPLFLPRSNPVFASSDSLKVMSYNVWGRNQNMSAIAELIKQEQPDILLLQELSPRAARSLRPELTHLYPDSKLHLAYEPQTYQGIISRYPLTPLKASLQGSRIQSVIVETPSGPITVWNVHTAQPWPWSRQYRQFSKLAKAVASLDGPLIVGGDFNTTDQSDAYHLVAQHLGNAHWEAGWGFGFSFPAPARPIHGHPLLTLPPAVRIDHIFHSHHFFTRSARTLAESGGSDHFPVIAEFSQVR